MAASRMLAMRRLAVRSHDGGRWMSSLRFVRINGGRHKRKNCFYFVENQPAGRNRSSFFVYLVQFRDISRFS